MRIANGKLQMAAAAQRQCAKSIPHSALRIPHSAFTLVELLVVIAIIGILVALLLPAVQAARESARRTQCVNNLKQLSLAVLLHHDAQRVFPRSGDRDDPDGWWAGAKSWSWIARSLPYMEEEDLYREGGIDTAVFKDNPVIGASLAGFLCPSDAVAIDMSPSTHPIEPGKIQNLWNAVPAGLTSYKACSGSNWPWGTYPNASTNSTDDPFNGVPDGLFSSSDVRFQRTLKVVTDGASNTFMIGEDIPEINAWSYWFYADGIASTCAISPNLMMPYDWPDGFSFRSRHPSGLHFAYADGSVHFVDEEIYLVTYRALSTIQGAEILSDNLPE